MKSTYALDTQVIQKNLCTGCGACQGLCPYWGTAEGRTVYYFECGRNGGRCQRFCPRMPFDAQALMKNAFAGEEIIPEIGPYRGLYLTQATDPQILGKAQHGGTVTALMKLAMEEGLIDAALMTGADPGKDPAGSMAHSVQEIMNSTGSAFRIPPSLAVLNKALMENEDKKIGVVGTPCKTLAVYKMMADENPGDRHHAKDNSALVVGLFCGWGLDWEGMEKLIAKYADPKTVTHVDIPPSKYHSLEITANGKVISVNLDEVIPLVRPACQACDDMTAEFADLSVGGARSADGWDVDKKWNQVIVRTKRGEELLELAFEKGVLARKDISDGALDKLKKASAGKKAKAKT